MSLLYNALGEPLRHVILNKKGKPVILNAREQKVADYWQRQCNALGYDVDITTLTTIVQKVGEQKFFQVAPADYVPIKVGQGAWSIDLTTFRSYDIGDDFSTGILDTGDNDAKLAMADAGVDAVTIKVFPWAKAVGWTIPQLQYASKAGNWDLVTAKARSRKKNFDLGIQKVAFLGLAGNSRCLGLLNQTGVTVDTTTLTGPISALSPADLKTFVSRVVEVYRHHNRRTAWCTHFVIPESDYNGLAAQASADFPIKSTLQLLLEAFQVVTGNANFKLLPCAYADSHYSGFSYQNYALYNYDEESIRMDIPVDFTVTLANTMNGFSFQNVGFSTFTGVMTYRPEELYYFQYPA